MRGCSPRRRGGIGRNLRTGHSRSGGGGRGPRLFAAKAGGGGRPRVPARAGLSAPARAVPGAAPRPHPVTGAPQDRCGHPVPLRRVSGSTAVGPGATAAAKRRSAMPPPREAVLRQPRIACAAMTMPAHTMRPRPTPTQGKPTRGTSRAPAHGGPKATPSSGARRVWASVQGRGRASFRVMPGCEGHATVDDGRGRQLEREARAGCGRPARADGGGSVPRYAGRVMGCDGPVRGGHAG